MMQLLAIVAAALGQSPLDRTTPPAQPASAVTPPSGAADLPVLVVTVDDTVIDRSCRVKIAPGKMLQDANGNGVIQITASGIVVEFEQGSWVRGAVFPTEPDAYVGIGITVRGQKDVAIRGARVRGYKCGILAVDSPGLVIEDSEVRDIYRQRLRSTAAAEDQQDWLWPHENDGREWVTKYGAAICIENSEHATVRRCVVRESQNGLILDRVTASGVYDNDFSFLSGWGVAMWRSTGNLVSRNALDFCIRGYSHGVYNRGQDSAGILMFEQCTANTIAENSVTHGGDGLFMFAGKEALGEKAPPPSAPGATPFEYKDRGCNNNLIIENDFSDAAAHGVEATFSFDNRVIQNRLAGNGICGVWGGYSQRMQVQGNMIERNGVPGSAEGGGINIEHGAANLIANNTFKGNSVGVSLWSDADEGLMKTPWAKANHKGSVENVIASNTFDGDMIGVQVRETRGTQLLANTMTGVGTPTKKDEASDVQNAEGSMDLWVVPESGAMGKAKPVGARAALAGRDKIVMTTWGPWDHDTGFVRFVERTGEGDVYEVVGGKKASVGQRSTKSVVRDLPVSPPAILRFAIAGDAPRAHTYMVALDLDGQQQLVKGTFIPLNWSARVFPWTADPRSDQAGWQRESSAATAIRLPISGPIRLPLGNTGPSGVPGWQGAADKMPWKDHYGVVADTTVRLVRGKYRFTSLSDDGIRVTVNANPSPRPVIRAVVIDNWTHHGPTRDVGELVMPESGDANILVEYFQIDGFAALDLGIEWVGLP